MRYIPELMDKIEPYLLEIPGVQKGQMMGHPAFYINRKMFCIFLEQGIAVKLPQDKYDELLERENYTSPFAPGGTKMGTWLQFNLTKYEDYEDKLNYFDLAVQFTANQPETKKSRKYRK
ncbi:MmcQ/YjbR family DNA-binding protein [bacterium]|nr:MmcQ/YjbR family DNA-binding protein [FCB group bacterium]MBL7190801.1 MmcQ/YjbR family DNA-binding protein [bacterium]